MKKLLLESGSTMLLAFCLAMLIIRYLRIYSNRLGMIDKPNHRKVHTNPVPVIGGVAIVLGVSIALFLSNTGFNFLIQHPVVLAGSLLLFGVGVWDDRNNISALLRLGIQFACVFAVAASGVRLTSLYGLFGIEDIPLVWQYLITAIIVVGVTNAFNLLDGIDGLAGGLALINISVLAGISFYLGQYSLFVLLVAIMGGIVGFLRYNLSRSKVFMGDAGSLLLGFLTSSVSILLIERGKALHSPELSNIVLLAASILIIPVFDSLRVYLGRMKKGLSPFTADKSHIHHLFLVIQKDHKRASLYIYCIEFIILITALLLHRFMGISLSILISSILFIGLSQVLLINKGVQKWQRIIKSMEQA